jgi:hypothetical protein
MVNQRLSPHQQSRALESPSTCPEPRREQKVDPQPSDRERYKSNLYEPLIEELERRKGHE